MPPVLRDNISSSPILPPIDLPPQNMEGERTGSLFDIGGSDAENEAAPATPASGYAQFSGSNTPAVPRKRVREDLTQVAQDAGRLSKLRKSSQNELNAMTAMSVAERQIQLAAVVLSLRDQVNLLSPTLAVENFTMPASMKLFIDKQSFILLMRPYVARYTDRDDDDLDKISEQGPKELLWGLLQRNPHVEFQANMRTNAKTKQIIMAYIRTKLNQRRCAIKAKIEASFGDKPDKNGDIPPRQDILELTRSVTQSLKGAKVRVTYQLCARIAYLRNAYQIAQKKNKDYWCTVDLELFETRGFNEVKQNKYIQMIFNADLHEFGSPAELERMRSSDLAPTEIEEGNQNEEAVSQEL